MVGFLLTTMTKLVKIGVIAFRVHSSCWTCIHYSEHCVSLHVFQQPVSSAIKPQFPPKHQSFSSPSQLHPVRLWGAVRVDHMKMPPSIHCQMTGLLYLELIASHMVGHLLLDSPMEGLQQCSPPLQYQEHYWTLQAHGTWGANFFEIANLVELVMKHFYELVIF